ncbi:MAG: hypothetical protein K0U86_00630 [Planctomycetes bacterium]|nr:hypothetical protein [Planctomycetota bacterium]MCH9775899.1 hypothetical protein [Planctomycetota bacterium]
MAANESSDYFLGNNRTMFSAFRVLPESKKHVLQNVLFIIKKVIIFMQAGATRYFLSPFVESSL